MRLKVRYGIEMTFKKLVLRCSGRKCVVKCPRETHCRLGPGLAPTSFKEITPKWSQSWSAGEALYFPSRRPDGKSMARI